MDFYLSFVAGILGSMHCVGMCGAVVLASTTTSGVGEARSSFLSRLPPHLVYNAGRVLAYALIGALAGVLGGVMGAVATLGTWFSLIAGVVMAITGLLMIGAIPRWRGKEDGDQTWLRRLHLKSVANLISSRTLESKFYIGLLTPLLPCGLLYGMFLRASATGSAVDGAVTMLLFGAGIVPALLVTGMVSAYVGLWLRSYANKLAAVTIIIMGITLIMRGAGIPFPFMGGHTGHMH